MFSDIVYSWYLRYIVNVKIITKYGCVFLKHGENIYIYVAMDLIPILLGSLLLAHNAQHSLVIGRAGASPPSRTSGPRCLYICI